jgi:tetratricopeptide (TPR) repeat protein
LKLFQNIVIVLGTVFILITAFTGADFSGDLNVSLPQQSYYAPDPNDPDGKPIKLSGEIEALDYDFPTQDGTDYSKEAINKAIQINLRGENKLVLGILYERLAYLEFEDLNYGAARVAYSNALSHYSNDHQKLRAAELFSSMAYLEAKTRNYASARDYYQKSATLYGQLGVAVRSDYARKIAERLPMGD